MTGRIYVVGIGPGNEEFLTGQAKQAIASADVIVGYTFYVELLQKIYPDKEYRSTGMRQELERCRLCFELAGKGRIVALICTGDAGVYGMASPVLEMEEEYQNSGIEIEIVPGITAALSGAAELGAPLGHDFCVISLSDLLTPWDVIEKRLQAAVLGDFAVALYNPSSRKRADYLERAVQIMLDAGAEETRAAGYVENIGRDGTKAVCLSLKELKTSRVNMFTTVFIGNSGSYFRNNRLITKRGYGEGEKS